MGVTASHGRFSRGVAVSSLDRTLFMMKYDPKSWEIARTKKLSHDDTRLSFLVDTGVFLIACPGRRIEIFFIER
jgi:hypothetical protein